MSDANREYKRIRTEIDTTIARLQVALHNHEARQMGHPEWWTFTGDAKHVRIQLLQICAFLGDDEARAILHAEGVER